MRTRHHALIVLGIAVVAALLLTRLAGPAPGPDASSGATSPVAATTEFAGADSGQALPEAAGARAQPATGSAARVPEGEPVFAARMPPDSPDSAHPVERAAAAGQLLVARWEPAATPGTWRRTRLMQTPVFERPVRVVDEWREPAVGAEPEVTLREIHLADEVIVRRASGADSGAFQARLAALGYAQVHEFAPQLYTVRLPKADLAAMPAALRALAADPNFFAHAEPNGLGFGGATADDFYYATHQWNLRNTGQSVGGVVGIAGVDIGVEAFWDVTTSAHGVVLAVLDSGLNYTHVDLQGIPTHDSGEIPGNGIDDDGNGIDDDGNGFIDDVRGWDWVGNDNDPTDDHGHGSNVTGIILATRNNAAGIAGIVEGASLITAKVLNSSNVGQTDHLIAATRYARLRGARVMNLSLQNYPNSIELATEFTACEAAGILLVICAGNQGVNNDTTPNYPSSYPHANIIAVGNHDNTGARWSGSGASNFGATSVDLFAPGRSIRAPGYSTTTSYTSFTGTSQATPHVTAIAAAILRVNPTWGAAEVKAALLGTVQTAPAYSGISVTGGRLRALPALAAALRAQADNDTDGDGWPNLVEYLANTRLDRADARPAVTLETVGADLRLSVPRTLRSDALLQIEMSTDLTSWTTAGVVDESTADTLRGRMTPAGTPPRGFLRLRAKSQP